MHRSATTDLFALNRIITVTRLVPDFTVSNLTGAGPGRILELKSGWILIWTERVFGSQNNISDKTNGINNCSHLL